MFVSPLDLQSFPESKPMKKATQQQTKEHNRNLVLKNILDHEEISRAEIARITHLTRTTVSDLVSELIAEGLVSEVGLGESIGGKSPILLSLSADSRFLIGLDLAHNSFYGAVVNLRGVVREAIEFPIQDCDGNEAIDAVYKILDHLVQSPHHPLVGIGVGAPGLVNTQHGVVINAVNLDWKNLDLGKMIRERYHLPVYIVNDSQAAALGEYTYHDARRSEESMVVINARHGIGAGVIINGQLFQGDGGGAGEIGHTKVIFQDGLPCRCGNTGCLETVASAQAVVRRIRTLSRENADLSISADPQRISFDMIVKAFHKDNPLARQVVLEAGKYMGFALSNLVSVLNIHEIVLTGDMTQFGKPWLEAIQKSMESASLDKLAHDTHLQIGKLGANRIALGASAMLLNDFSMLFRLQSSN
jgi:N-acetylglucosamine repressor